MHINASARRLILLTRLCIDTVSAASVTFTRDNTKTTNCCEIVTICCQQYDSFSLLSKFMPPSIYFLSDIYFFVTFFLPRWTLLDPEMWKAKIPCNCGMTHVNVHQVLENLRSSPLWSSLVDPNILLQDLRHKMKIVGITYTLFLPRSREKLYQGMRRIIPMPITHLWVRHLGIGIHDVFTGWLYRSAAAACLKLALCSSVTLSFE